MANETPGNTRGGDQAQDQKKAKGTPTLLEQLRSGQTLWSLRYKYVRGITNALILASSREQAEAVGRAWVNSQPGRMFLDVNAAIIADESILANTSTPEVVGAGGVTKR